MKLKLTLALIAGLAIPALPASAESVEDAEKQLMQACMNDDNNSSEGCKCVIDGLKRELKPESYSMFMEMFSVAMTGDVAEMMRFALSGKIPLDKMEAMGTELEAISKKLDKECDDVNMIYKADPT
ncbi:hypothetical protein GCM10017044_11590 [Kordiimonas sediminis]|uniref:Uncharacterized protein n=1 Tax=Kordiimonas sediminis TaxID=1735581 RepID=A0A919APJ4_9PROT|nr:hypothetical protein [Kordiimonas sediminis]GHF18736.1 hypothetical protein GCM10017044_11590 [Kordiimonas sediminis]